MENKSREGHTCQLSWAFVDVLTCKTSNRFTLAIIARDASRPMISFSTQCAYFQASFPRRFQDKDVFSFGAFSRPLIVNSSGCHFYGYYVDYYGIQCY